MTNLGLTAFKRHRRAAGAALPDPEEVIARALCHEDPDAETARGPLWTGYRREARRVIAALGSRLAAPDAEAALRALGALVDQVELAGYRDPQGHPLELNVVFIKARELVKGYR